jgi:hypothetical protein
MIGAGTTAQTYVREVGAMDPRRGLQLALIVAAAVAVLLALTGFGPGALSPVPGPAVVVTR